MATSPDRIQAMAALKTLAWKLASPYDAYVSHVVKLHHALERVRQLSEQALAYEAGLQGSVRFVPGSTDAALRVRNFRARLGQAAASMTDEQFEEFLAHLGGGAPAEVEADRAKAVSRLTSTTRGIEEYFATAAHELAVLEERGYNPHRPDVARQLRENGLAQLTVAEYRRQLHELGSIVAMRAAPGKSQAAAPEAS